MLIEFRVKNFRSLRDEQVLSLVASKDKSLLEGLTVGDKVQFAADKQGSQYVVTELKAAD